MVVQKHSVLGQLVTNAAGIQLVLVKLELMKLNAMVKPIPMERFVHGHLGAIVKTVDVEIKQMQLIRQIVLIKELIVDMLE